MRRTLGLLFILILFHGISPGQEGQSQANQATPHVGHLEQPSVSPALAEHPTTWQVDVQHDPMDDSTRASMAVPARNLVDGKRAVLVIRCQTGKVLKEPEVYVVTGTPLAVESGAGWHDLRIRFDAEPPESSVWTDGNSLESVFHDPEYRNGDRHSPSLFGGTWYEDDPEIAIIESGELERCVAAAKGAKGTRACLDAAQQRKNAIGEHDTIGESRANAARENPIKARDELRFIQRIAAAKVFRIEYTPFQGVPGVAEFETQGATEPLKKLSTACGWPETN
jgi:hypothetical protein